MMRLLPLCIVAAVCLLASASPLPAADTVVIPEDHKEFRVVESALVRLEAKGVTGSKITAEIEGPAKVGAEYHIHRRKNGTTPDGFHEVGFDIKPTGKGQVKVIISIKPPKGDAKHTTYEFAVE